MANFNKWKADPFTSLDANSFVRDLRAVFTKHQRTVVGPVYISLCAEEPGYDIVREVTIKFANIPENP